MDTNSLYGFDSSSCVWFKFIAPKMSTYVFETTGSIDTLGALFNNLVTGLSFDGMITNAYDDDSGIDNNFKISYMLSKNQIVYIRVTGKTSNSSGEFGFSVTSNDHIHSYTASYMYSSISTHLAYCNCGDFIYESHNYVLHNYRKKCSKCLHISSGLIPVNPVNLIFNQNEINEIKENSEN